MESNILFDQLVWYIVGGQIGNAKKVLIPLPPPPSRIYLILITGLVLNISLKVVQLKALKTKIKAL